MMKKSSEKHVWGVNTLAGGIRNLLFFCTLVSTNVGCYMFGADQLDHDLVAMSGNNVCVAVEVPTNINSKNKELQLTLDFRKYGKDSSVSYAQTQTQLTPQAPVTTHCFQTDLKDSTDYTHWTVQPKAEMFTLSKPKATPRSPVALTTFEAIHVTKQPCVDPEEDCLANTDG